MTRAWRSWRMRQRWAKESHGVALIHVRDDCPDGVRTQEIAMVYLDMEIHDGELVFRNGYDEEFRTPVDSLVTLEIR